MRLPGDGPEYTMLSQSKRCAMPWTGFMRVFWEGGKRLKAEGLEKSFQKLINPTPPTY
jgi:hypothetical protein